MSNFDFEKYKKSYDKVTVSDERKEELIALMKKENNSTVNGTKPQSQNKIITFKRVIVLAASIVLIVLVAIFSQKLSVNQNSQSKRLDKNNSFTVSLSNDKKKKGNKEYKIKEKDTIIPLENNGVQIISKDGGNTISLNSLYFNIKGSEIDYIDVSSKNDNSIICTYADDEDNLTTEFNSNYQKLKLQNINDLGWIVSEKNASEAMSNANSSVNTATPNSSSNEYSSSNKYFSDTVGITIHYKNGESVTKNIEIKFDNDNNVIVGYEK